MIEVGDVFKGGDIVGHQRNGLDTEVAKNVGGHVVAPVVVFEAEHQVGVDCVEALSLLGVRANLVSEADSLIFPRICKNFDTSYVRSI